MNMRWLYGTCHKLLAWFQRIPHDPVESFHGCQRKQMQISSAPSADYTKGFKFPWMTDLTHVHIRYVTRKNLTFSAEFRGCSAQNDADNPRIDRGESAYWPRRIRVSTVENPGSGCGWSARIVRAEIVEQRTKSVCRRESTLKRNEKGIAWTEG